MAHTVAPAVAKARTQARPMAPPAPSTAARWPAGRRMPYLTLAASLMRWRSSQPLCHRTHSLGDRGAARHDSLLEGQRRRNRHVGDRVTLDRSHGAGSQPLDDADRELGRKAKAQIILVDDGQSPREIGTAARKERGV